MYICFHLVMKVVFSTRTSSTSRVSSLSCNLGSLCLLVLVITMSAVTMFYCCFVTFADPMRRAVSPLHSYRVSAASYVLPPLVGLIGLAVFPRIFTLYAMSTGGLKIGMRRSYSTHHLSPWKRRFDSLMLHSSYLQCVQNANDDRNRPRISTAYYPNKKPKD